MQIEGSFEGEDHTAGRLREAGNMSLIVEQGNSSVAELMIGWPAWRLI